MGDETVKGAAAGTVGVWVMDVVTWFLYRRQSKVTIAKEKKARKFGQDPAHAGARHLAKLAGSGAARSEPNAGGIFIHYLLGIGPGMVYARLRRANPAVTVGKGAVWGAGLYLANDLVAGRLLRIMGPQRDYPWQAHARGIVGHVVLGVTTHAVLAALDDAS
ncbi:MAG TPA: hypothetical protein VM324_12360 [Egibacteraceae bacterium]|jgi:tetrahydromethanopterin S-methyltransferase subunit D|nr:hypothetical protein [Egibacteraceae bacterium]